MSQRHWRRVDVHWRTGGRELFSNRSCGAILRYLGGARWEGAAWYYSRAVKYWKVFHSNDLGKRMRAAVRWLDARPTGKEGPT